jgi:hypothetical protein
LFYPLNYGGAGAGRRGGNSGQGGGRQASCEIMEAAGPPSLKEVKFQKPFSIKYEKGWKNSVPKIEESLKIAWNRAF